jgi:integrase
MLKVDPHDRKRLFEEWKDSEIKDLSKPNANILREFILDLESGLNVGGNKGTRSPGRLLANISQLKRVMRFAEKYFKVHDITKINEKQLHQLFLDIQSGKIKKENGEVYSFVGDIIKRFKTFWHWYMKKSKKEGKDIQDITLDLKAESSKAAKFVYFTKEKLEEMIKAADRDIELKTFMAFLFDTGIRSPTEALNSRVSDFSDDYKQFQIREEVSKTFGRKIRLMFCSDAIERYIKGNNLRDDDLLFTFKADTMNQKLKKLGKKVIGDKQTLGKKKGSELTMYDFRHSSCCYWLPRYKVRSQLLYRFGWRQEKEIHYYSNLLGMSDGISEDDLLIGMDKTAIEKEIINLREAVKILMANEVKQNKKIEELMDGWMDKQMKEYENKFHELRKKKHTPKASRRNDRKKHARQSRGKNPFG